MDRWHSMSLPCVQKHVVVMGRTVNRLPATVWVGRCLRASWRTCRCSSCGAERDSTSGPSVQRCSRRRRGRFSASYESDTAAGADCIEGVLLALCTGVTFSFLQAAMSKPGLVPYRRQSPIEYASAQSNAGGATSQFIESLVLVLHLALVEADRWELLRKLCGAGYKDDYEGHHLRILPMTSAFASGTPKLSPSNVASKLSISLTSACLRTWLLMHQTLKTHLNWRRMACVQTRFGQGTRYCRRKTNQERRRASSRTR